MAMEYPIDGFLLPRSRRTQRKSRNNPASSIVIEKVDEPKIPKYCLFCSSQTENIDGMDGKIFESKNQRIQSNKNGFAGALCNLFALPPLEFEGNLKRAVLCSICIARCQQILRSTAQVEYWKQRLSENKKDLENVLQTAVISSQEPTDSHEGKLRASLLNYLEISPPGNSLISSSEFGEAEAETEVIEAHEQNLDFETKVQDVEKDSRILDVIDIKIEKDILSDECDLNFYNDNDDAASVRSDATDFESSTQPFIPLCNPELVTEASDQPEKSMPILEKYSLKFNDPRLRINPVSFVKKLDISEFNKSKKEGGGAFIAYLKQLRHNETKWLSTLKYVRRNRKKGKYGKHGYSTKRNANARGIVCPEPKCSYRAKRSKNSKDDLRKLRIHQSRFHQELLPVQVPRCQRIPCPYPTCTYKSKPRPGATMAQQQEALHRHMRFRHNEFSDASKKVHMKCSVDKCTFIITLEETEWGETPESRMKAHVLRAHEKKAPYPCNICDKKFRTKKKLDIHTYLHTGERPFVCEICGKGFRAEEFIKAHMNNHKGGHPFKCDTCQRGFNSMSHLKAHIIVHTGERPFKCGSCEETFTQNRYLQVHRWKFHPEECMKEPKPKMSYLKLSVQPVAKLAKTWECSVCKKMFVSKKVLEGHFRIHSGEKPFKCNFCNTTFRYKYLVKLHHFKEHKVEDSSSDAMSQNWREPDKFICEECGHQCKSKQLLSLHVDSHHSTLGLLKPNKCTVPGCNKSFGPKRYLQMHLRNHRVKGELPPNSSLMGEEMTEVITDQCDPLST